MNRHNNNNSSSNNSNHNSNHDRGQQQQQRQQQQQQQQKQQQQQPQQQKQQQQEQQDELLSWQEYAAHYPIALTWPPIILQSKQESLLRTSPSLVHSQLHQAGLVFFLVPEQQEPPEPEPPREELPVSLVLFQSSNTTTAAAVRMTLQETMERLQQFVHAMEQTNCYHKVQVQLVPATVTTTKVTDTTPTAAQLHITLHEKNWYSLKAGASFQTNTASERPSLLSSSSSNAWPSAEAEVSFGLRNVLGLADTTQWSYTVDASTDGTTGRPSWTWTHQRPLVLSLSSWSSPHDSSQIPITFLAKAFLTTLDYHTTRRYGEYQRGLLAQWTGRWRPTTWTPSAVPSSSPPPPPPPIEWSLTAQAILRDIIPTPSPFQSWMILQQAGPHFKQSVVAQLSQTHSPTTTTCPHWNWNIATEVALPDWLLLLGHADASFVKTQLQAAWHCPIYPEHFRNNTQKEEELELEDPRADRIPPSTSTPIVTFHSLFQMGYLHHLQPSSSSSSSQQQRSGSCSSDRLFLGGPLPFRGFLPSGIGPRAAAVDDASPGPALGGDFCYTWTPMLSIPLSSTTTTSTSSSSSWPPFQAFVFGTVGTCVGSLSHVYSQIRRQQQEQQQQQQQQQQSPWSFVAPSTQTAWTVLQSSRASVGCGLATTLQHETIRLEATYAIPLRYGPHDLRRNLQWSVAVNLHQ